MPKSALTGTQKKAQRRDIKFRQKQQEEFMREHEATRGTRRQSAKALKEIAGGKRGVTTDIGDLMKQFQEAQKFAKEIYKPTQENILRDYQQNFLPQVNTALGSNAKSSSALNQALAASAENLQRGIGSDINSLAQSLLGQSQQGKLQNIQAMLQASGAGLGHGIAPSVSPYETASPYLPKGGPSLGSQIGGGFIKGIGNFIGGGLGGGLEAYGNRLGGTTGIGQGVGMGGVQQYLPAIMAAAGGI